MRKSVNYGHQLSSIIEYLGTPANVIDAFIHMFQGQTIPTWSSMCIMIISLRMHSSMAMPSSSVTGKSDGLVSA